MSDLTIFLSSHWPYWPNLPCGESKTDSTKSSGSVSTLLYLDGSGAAEDKGRIALLDVADVEDVRRRGSTFRYRRR